MGLIRGKAETKRFGLIANPIAGMGSGAGLKGTDDGMHKDAMTLGAQPVAPARTRAFLSQIRHWDRIRLLVAPAIMGGSYVDAALPTEVVEIGTIADETSGKDTKRIAAGADCLLALAGDIVTMPGLPQQPGAYRVDLSDDGHVTGF